MTQFEFYKSFLFVVELLVAEGLYVGKLKRRNHFVIRVILAVAFVTGVAFLLPAGEQNPFYCALLFSLIFGVTIPAWEFCYDEKWFSIVFCCFAGYSVQHLSYEAYNIFLQVTNLNSSTGFYGSGGFLDIFPNLFVFSFYLTIYTVCYFICYIFFGTKLSANQDVKIEKNFVFVFAVVVFAVDILLNAFIVYDTSDVSGKYGIIIGVYNILCCAIALYLQFEVATRKKIESEYDTMRGIWKMQKKQFEMSRRNIEIINMKCHDLKHQIHSIGTDEKISKEALKEIESHISIYDSSAKTGNDALDVILTEKSLLCNKEKIDFSFMADGEKLSFMRKEDIYALFGNIIDNAIEAVMKLDETKRVISLKVKSLGNMLVINSFNYYDGEIIFENGAIITRKHDKTSHGFGIKSIKYICSRYDGDVQINTESDVFTLNVLIPIPVQQ